MFTKISLFRLLSALLIGGMLLGNVAFPIVVRADEITANKITRIEKGLPTGLSAADWAQIEALLPSQQAYLKAPNTGAGDGFGNPVAVDGNTVVVGATGEASNATGVDGNQADNSASGSGAAYVFTRSGTTWSQQAYLKASNTEPYDYFGLFVAISGDTLVVAATGEDSNATGVDGNQADNSASGSGAAYVFTRSGTTWSQQAYLKTSNTGAVDLFGSSVAIDGDTLVVGAFLEDSNATGSNGDSSNNSTPDSGAAYVFTRSGTTWSQQAYLKASNTGAVDYFGGSVAIDGDTLVVGARLEDSNATGSNGDGSNNSTPDSGASYVFSRSGTTWSQQAYLKASNTEKNDRFGISAAISGDTVVVGALGESSSDTGVNGNQADNSAPGAGAAYVFNRSGTTWNQQAYLKASNTEKGDRFGISVAISGDTVVVGAVGESSNATGVNGNGSDNSAYFSGAAYAFTRNRTTWSQRAYLKASNTEAGDGFGWSVAISGDTVVVGAREEDSNATGVNGDQNNNSAVQSGAAYVYVPKPPAILLLQSVSTKDGWILEFTETSGVGGSMNVNGQAIVLGDDATDKQYRSILHFNTSSLPDNATITKVTLLIKKKAVVGTDPFTTHLYIKVGIRSGGFSNNTALQLTDFQSAASKNWIGTIKNTPVGDWYSAVLNKLAFPFVNLTSATQFRLSFALDDDNDNLADYMQFFSGNAATADRPQLIVEYYTP